jgi:hypothetical protein
VHKRGSLELGDLPERVRKHLDAARFEATEPAELAAVSLLDLRRNAAPTAEELRAVVEAYAGNVAKVASFFGKDRRQIYRWAQALGVDIQALRESRDVLGQTLPPAHAAAPDTGGEEA